MMRRRMAVASPESGVRELHESARGKAPWAFRQIALVSWLLGCCLLLLACSKGGAGGGEGLLAGRPPSRSEGVVFAERMTDGVVPRQGTAWNNNRTARLGSRSAFVEYDLGGEQKIAAAAILADNNDHYEISTSSDGKTFETLWVAPVSEGSRPCSASNSGECRRRLSPLLRPPPRNLQLRRRPLSIRRLPKPLLPRSLLPPSLPLPSKLPPHQRHHG